MINLWNGVISPFEEGEGPVPGGAKIAEFPNRDWWNLLELARRFGFDDIPHTILAQYPLKKRVLLNGKAVEALYKALVEVRYSGINFYDDHRGVAPAPQEADAENIDVAVETAHKHPELQVSRAQLWRLMLALHDWIWVNPMEVEGGLIIERTDPQEGPDPIRIGF